MPILSMKEFQEFKKKELRVKVEVLRGANITPTLCIITDDKDKRTQSYMKSKLKIAEELGIYAKKCVIDNNLDEIRVLGYMNVPTICQLPIDKKIEEYYNQNLYLMNDVDGFKDGNKLLKDDYSNIPATPKGIMEFLEFIKYNLRGKTVVIIGRGELVGKPLSILMMNKGATVITLNSKSSEFVRSMALASADIVVCASGVKGSVKSSELNDFKDVIVFNVGTCFEGGKLTTELEIDEDKPNIYYTDRIGAVGICTVLSLMDNVVNNYKSIDK